MAVKQVIDDLKGMNNQGLTIIEIIFALSRRVTEATTLAEDRLERLMMLPYDNIIDGQEKAGAYHISWAIIENEIADKTKSVTVTVTRAGGLKPTNVVIRDLISKNG
jgi:hypothetical protein